MKLLLLLFIVSCSNLPSRQELNIHNYVYMKYANKHSGTVTHMNITHPRFRVQPADYSDSLISEACRGKYVITGEELSVRPKGVIALEGNPWIKRSFVCI